MAEQFYTILTTTGKAKIANSLPTGKKVNITKMKIGDSNGTYYNPSESQTDLVHKVYECNITSVEVDENNPSWITITAAIPSDVGGFSIREVGVFDDSNSLIAIGKYPETYKPVASDGSTKELYIKMTLEVTNASSVELKIDPTVILATKKDINNLDVKIQNNASQLKDVENNKVDKITGKGLSTNDYDNTQKAEVAKIASKADKAYVDTQISNIGNASPKGTYETLLDLQTAYPSGTTGIYVITADGKWYYWNGTAWTAGGTYQSTGMADKSITPNKTSFQQVDLTGVTYESGYYINKNDGSKVSHTNTSYYASSYISVIEGLSYVLKTCTDADLGGMGFYDAYGSAISGLATTASLPALGETEFVVPIGTKTIRFTCVGTAMLSGVLLAVKSNAIDTASMIAKTTVEKADTNSALFYNLYDYYFEGLGTIDSVPTVFNKVATYGSPNAGIVALGNKVVNITSATLQASGGCGFKIVLPKLTPNVIKAANAIQLEMDVTMQKPAQFSYAIGVYAQKRASGVLVNTNVPLVYYPMTLSALGQQHVSKKLTFSYDDIINKVVAGGDVAFNQIECFGIYVIAFSAFSDNTLTFSNIYLDKVNDINKKLDSLSEIDIDLQEQIKRNNQMLLGNIFTNYVIDDVFSVMKVFCPTKGDIVIDNTNKTVSIDNTNDLTGGSAGVYIPLTSFYELIKTNGKAKIVFTGKASFNGSLMLQLYPHTASGNFNNYYIGKSYTSSGETVSLSLEVEITMQNIESFMATYSYDIATLDHFVIYLRANTISNDFNCTISQLKFETENAIIKVQNEIGSLSNNTSAFDSEKPLDIIKRDGGLFPIFHKVGYIGDSLSSGEHEYTKDDNTTGYIDLFPYSYGQVIARATGTEALNFSSGGRTAATWLAGFSTQAFETPANICQAYVIYLGTNDLDPNKNPYGMGNVATDIDINNYNNNGLTFAGQYAKIIQRIKEVQPKAKIFCCTLPKAPTHLGEWAPNSIIRAIPGMFDNVYLLDLFTYADVISSDFRLGFHLTSAGYKIFGWQIMSYIDYLIRKYPSEFKQVAFIGTNYYHV